MKTKRKTTPHDKKPMMICGEEYKKPAIEIIEVELEQSILAGSANGSLTDIEGAYW